MPFEIKHPITGGILQVAEDDFPDLMDWYEAMAACQNLGKGWRLPTKEELKAMYEQLHKQGKGNFGSIDFKMWYWSSSEYSVNGAWYLDFKDGKAYRHYSHHEGFTEHVRAVRDLR
jgi:hypothetical protein